MERNESLRLFTDGVLFVSSGSCCCCTGGFAGGIGAAGRLLPQLLLLRPVVALLRLALDWSIRMLGAWSANSSCA
jgi:hypothetical protein